MPNSDLIVLDTHVWVWSMLNQTDKVSSEIQELMNSAFAEKRLALSAISAWEVGMLVSKQRLQLDLPCLEWVKQASEGFTLLPLSLDIAVESSFLPHDFHGDPADRIIVTTAKLHQATLITNDGKILDYAKQHGIVSVLAVR
jgi:PIN domain nuclease of toxin-antitoxin system